ncbi:MAG: helix-turn-helix transcriptional regulator [Actinomycetota bacterium]
MHLLRSLMALANVVAMSDQRPATVDAALERSRRERTMGRESRWIPHPSTWRSIRRAAGVDVDVIARELGVHPATVYRWEAGDIPTGDRLGRYGDILARLAEAAS